MKKYANHTPADQGIRVARLDNHTPDDLNPAFIFQGTKTELLKKMAFGHIDPMQLVYKEFSNRGLDQFGTWVGFQTSAEIYKQLCDKNGWQFGL